MATQAEKSIHDLKVEVVTLNVLVQSLRTDLALLYDLPKKVAVMESELASLRELPKQVAVLQAQLAEATKTRELWGQRGWTILQLVFAAILGATLTYLLRIKS